MKFRSEIEQSVDYLGSNEALCTLGEDAYWPKWHAPWWHMLLLHEMGLTSLIPETTVKHFVAALNRIPVKFFPIQPDSLPPGTDPSRVTPCHCQLGNVYQVLAAWGVNVDAELPWIRPWFLRYQMADGGLNCDEGAYRVPQECPSSMVGTIAVFEAILLYTPRCWTPEEACFLRNAAQFLIERELRLGSKTTYNAEEQASAETWTQLCFPRFYFYDVLRGLNALALWAEKTGHSVPLHATQFVVESLTQEFGDGPVRLGRRPFEGAKTLKQSSDGQWLRRQEAHTFPLLEAVSAVGEESSYLTSQWHETKRRIQGTLLASMQNEVLIPSQ